MTYSEGDLWIVLTGGCTLTVMLGFCNLKQLALFTVSKLNFKVQKPAGKQVRKYVTSAHLSQR